MLRRPAWLSSSRFGMRRRPSLGVTLSLLLPALLAGPAGAAEQPAADAVRDAVSRALDRELDADDLRVTVRDADVTLSGRVDTLRVEREAIRIALDVPGVDTVASDLVIPPAESDEALAGEVGRAIRDYPHHTLWDHLTAVVRDGVVTLGGRVTPDRDKAGEIVERLSRIPGVQDIVDTITPLSPSLTDAALRRRIDGRLFASPLFARFGATSSPPFRILVESASVTLIGSVPSEVERVEMERVVADVPGVRRVDNRLQTSR